MQIEIMPNAPVKRAPNNPWPEWPRIFKETPAHQEGCSRKWNINTLEAIGENGKVKALRCTEIEWHRGEDGRMYNVPKKDGEFVLQADLVLLAMGFTGHAIPEIVSAFNLRTDERGRVFRDSTGMTSAKGVYIAGDCATGQSLVVRAITDGKRVANGIIRTLLG
jgi:glutamate synthase (NADPH/NADH) small chain